MQANYGCLYVVATPIGNLEDISYRAIRILKEVDIIYAENRKVSSILLKHYQIKKHLFGCNSRNELHRISEIITHLKNGNNLAYISDAGTPSISDPGTRIVSSIRNEHLQIIPIPGASAVTSALSASGIPTDHFFFYGFLPNKKGREKIIQELATVSSTIIFYESPYRIHKTCEQLYNILGDRYVVIAREMTKKFEEFLSGWLSSFVYKPSQIKKKGELVLLVAPKKFKK